MDKLIKMGFMMFFLLIICLSPIYAVSDITIGPGWRLAFQGNTDWPTNFIGFINEKKGMTVGSNGECHYTEDGGKSWLYTYNQSQCRCLDFLDDTTVYSCGAVGHIRFSKDGGKNWDKKSDCENAPNFISFCDVTTGWAGVSINKLFTTADGGDHWSPIETPGKPNPMSGITLLSATSGYVLIEEPEGSVLYLTEDGGKSWQKQSTVCQESLFCPAIRFFDSGQGVIIGSTKGKVQEFRTMDGGKTWQSETIFSQTAVPFLTRNGKILTLLGFDNSYYVLTKR
jgi:photosystem II stability/assembly factor-like uncharacterized protein